MINNTNFPSIEQVTSQYLKNRKINTTDVNVNESGMTFNEVLDELKSSRENTTLKFSKHADARLNERNISLSGEQLKRLEDGTLQAYRKGIKESLVLLDNYAFIVNTKSNTVITAMDNTKDTENIYTNIDGAVII